MMKPKDRTTVLIAAAEALFREGIKSTLGAQDDLLVVGDTDHAAGALKLIAETTPDVALLDEDVLGAGYAAMIGRMRELSATTRLIVLGVFDNPRMLSGVIGAGASGCLPKCAQQAELLWAIHSIRCASDRVLLAVPRRSLALMDRSASSPLSERECEILELAGQAMSNNQIASSLSITEATVKRHLRNVFAKLGAVSRIDAVNKAGADALITVWNRQNRVNGR